ncbi:MAG: hypothetical protein A2176_01950 [Spirochaetes bacterium RBG_13_51_14]|nr:MAG: hypothetical protein A2176_01950 [Spirochaetes bacterium RBG_13_51_14]
MFTNIAVFGLGLLGGSICRGLKKINPDIRITAYGRNASRLEPALKDAFVDTVGSFERISLAGVDLAVVSTPADVSVDIISRLIRHAELGPAAIIIDVGSVKEPIIRSVTGMDRSDRFVGCHPMAGSEKMGYEHSREDLFDGATVIITPHSGNRDGDIRMVREFWEGLKARTVIVKPEEHDRIVTYTSHLPHIVASSLVRVFDEFNRDQAAGTDLRSFVGTGFRDVTRVSSGSPDMWRDIALLNRENILHAVVMMIDELERLKKALADGEEGSRILHEYFSAAKNVRDGLT